MSTTNDTQVLPCKPGDRIGVYLYQDEPLPLVGYGVYFGGKVPPPWVENYGTNFAAEGIENPMLLLDDGRIYWGCFCWWGPEEEIKALAATAKEVENITVTCEEVVAGDEERCDEVLNTQVLPEELQGEMEYSAYALVAAALAGAGVSKEGAVPHILKALPVATQVYRTARATVVKILTAHLLEETEKWSAENQT
jgi:hypothetical protein